MSKPMNKQVSVRSETKIIAGKLDTRFYVDLPEYESEIIIKEKHVEKLIDQLVLLKNFRL